MTKEKFFAEYKKLKWTLTDPNAGPNAIAVAVSSLDKLIDELLKYMESP